MPNTLRLGLPKGRMEAGVHDLLACAGIRITPTARCYRPSTTLEWAEVKTQKPQNVIEMMAIGRRDAGFAGADWVAELGAPVVEVLDLGLDPVRIVAAAPADVWTLERRRRPLVVASEYERLARHWMERSGLDDSAFVRSYGATEVFPPEDADVIVDCSATGATLEANNLKVDWEGIESAPNEALVNALAMMSPYGPAEKQAMLEAPDLKTRAEILIAVTEMDLAKKRTSGDPGLQ